MVVVKNGGYWFLIKHLVNDQANVGVRLTNVYEYVVNGCVV